MCCLASGATRAHVWLHWLSCVKRVPAGVVSGPVAPGPEGRDPPQRAAHVARQTERRAVYAPSQTRVDMPGSCFPADVYKSKEVCFELSCLYFWNAQAGERGDATARTLAARLGLATAHRGRCPVRPQTHLSRVRTPHRRGLPGTMRGTTSPENDTMQESSRYESTTHLALRPHLKPWRIARRSALDWQQYSDSLCCCRCLHR